MTHDDVPQALLSVGGVARRLGMPTSTLRTWDQRYGVGPSSRSAGGHRRYGPTDVARVALVRAFVDAGVPAAEAANVASTLSDDGVSAALASPPVLGPPSSAPAEALVDAIVRAVAAADAHRVRTLWVETLRDRDVVDAWGRVIAPALGRIGRGWSAGTIDVSGEHLASDSLHEVLRARLGTARGTSPQQALLAGADGDLHGLPLLALQAALAEQGVRARSFGPRLPATSLAEAVRTTAPAVVFLWASTPRPVGDPTWTAVDPEVLPVVVGGPGWTDRRSPRLPTAARHAPTLAAAFDAINTYCAPRA